MQNITELIKGNYVYFDSLRQGFAHYILRNPIVKIDDPEYNGKKPDEVPEYILDRFLEIENYTFIIPLDDIGNGTLRKEMKAIEVMRWIRKCHEDGTLIKLK